MGWSYAKLPDGREIGYSVDAVCEHPGCNKQIDRGLAYVCGGMHEGGDNGCGHYFCYEHLFMSIHGQLCQVCDDQVIENETAEEIES